MYIQARIRKYVIGGADLPPPTLNRVKVDLTTGELRQLVERAAQDREAAIRGLEGAAEFGSSAMILTIGHNSTDHSIFEEKKQERPPHRSSLFDSHYVSSWYKA